MLIADGMAFATPAVGDMVGTGLGAGTAIGAGTATGKIQALRKIGIKRRSRQTVGSLILADFPIRIGLDIEEIPAVTVL